ncbi:hypothetical protein SAMN02745181_3174 [Rubritalea squalenifaciens DSM 18772]|uniref:Uncharacterized protein n=1 Tax=Rubritalea squalenifaciens DSM 18772 TaxID=1123071 RepID=A0A1M6PFJ5_9BACT|nr:hypothetical protein SAMN02745181_3174 [Rubritalea squalenifaciens DSM 18772]
MKNTLRALLIIGTYNVLTQSLSVKTPESIYTGPKKEPDDTIPSSI